MLTIRDFRAGNYYYRNLGNGNMVYLFQSELDFSSLNDTIDQYSPIPLTPKFAEMLGFKYFNSSSKKNTRTWYLNHFFIYFGKKKGPKINNNYHIPYLHNLQDLYWERYRKLLKIKYNY